MAVNVQNFIEEKLFIRILNDKSVSLSLKRTHINLNAVNTFICTYTTGWRGNVLTAVCLIVCVFVNTITQTVIGRFSGNPENKRIIDGRGGHLFHL